MKSNNSLYIRRAHVDEIVSILSEWQIATKLSKPVLECLGTKYNFTLIVINGYRLLVSYRLYSPKSEGLVDVHIACPRASIRASRALALVGMRWLAEDKNVRAKKLITSAPIGKISNFLLRLGFKQDSTIEPKGNLVYFTYKY